MKKVKLVSRLHIGEKEFRKDFPNENINNFPLYDHANKGYYRYNAGMISDEEYDELQKCAPKWEKVPKKKNISGWYIFAIILIVLGCFGGVFVGVESGNMLIAICVVLGVLVFFSQIILLSKIEYNTREAE